MFKIEGILSLGSRDECEMERHENEISPANAAYQGSLPPRKTQMLSLQKL